MHESNPIHAVKRENNFYFISSWEFISEMRRRNFSNVKVLVHPQMSDDEILDWIFQSQVAKIYLGLISNKEIQFLHRMLDEDYRRKKDLFQNSSPRTSLTALMLLTGKTRAEMRTILGSKTMKSDLELWLEQNK